MTTIGLGTAAIGRPQYINIKQKTGAEDEPFQLSQFKQQGIALLETAYQSGIRYFDTAAGYGIAEEMLTDWLSGKQISDITVATKWGYTYVAGFDPNAKVHEIKEHSLKKLNAQWEHSKKLLPYLSVYQIHSATLESGVLDNMEVLSRLAELKNEYQIKIGLTTSGSRQKEALLKALDIEVDGKPLFDACQLTYNVYEQSIYDIVAKIKKANIKVIVKEALANGRVFANKKYPHYLPHYTLLYELAEKYNTGVEAVAIRYCMDSIQPNVVLSGAYNEETLMQNLEALNFKLEPEELEDIRTMNIMPEFYWNERTALTYN